MNRETEERGAAVMAGADDDSEIWAALCECDHMLTDHWFDMTKQPPEPDTGCRECDCSGFKIAADQQPEVTR